MLPEITWVVSASAGKTMNASDALHSEDIGLQNGLLLADRMGIGHIVISTDSQILKQAIVSSSHDQDRLGSCFWTSSFT
jgi:hypothetical protein